jgi:hypothetical protein
MQQLCSGLLNARCHIATVGNEMLVLLLKIDLFYSPLPLEEGEDNMFLRLSHNTKFEDHSLYESLTCDLLVLFRLEE